MHQCGRPVLLERRTQARRVRNVAFEERSPFHCPAVTARKIVVGDRQVAFRGKRLAGVTADVARAAGHEDVHRTRPSLASFNPSSRKQFKSDPIIAAFRLPSVEQIPLSIALPSAHPCRFRADGPEETAVLAIGWRQIPPRRLHGCRAETSSAYARLSASRTQRAGALELPGASVSGSAPGLSGMGINGTSSCRRRAFRGRSAGQQRGTTITRIITDACALCG